MPFEIVTDPEKLKRKCEIITKPELKTFLPIFEEMKSFLTENRGCGLAAPQIGIQKLFFITRDDSDRFKIFLNPFILKTSLEKFSITEGCFSCPDIVVPMNRSRKIKMSYMNQNWISKMSVFSDLESGVIQHEYDHLYGRLISDNLLINRLTF